MGPVGSAVSREEKKNLGCGSHLCEFRLFLFPYQPVSGAQGLMLAAHPSLGRGTGRCAGARASLETAFGPSPETPLGDRVALTRALTRALGVPEGHNLPQSPSSCSGLRDMRWR